MSKDSSELFTKKFFTWMASEGLKPKDLAVELHKAEQTVANWGSRGVPKAQWVACEAIMERRNAKKAADSAQEDQTFVIRPTYKQFQNWNYAAMEEGKLMTEWAVDGLNALAMEPAARALAVADKKGDYSPKDQSSS